MTVLFVVATVVVFLGIDWAVRRWRQQPSTSQELVKSPPLRSPEGIFFTPSHTWLSLYPSGKIRLGVDDFISRLVANPAITLLKRTGDRICKGDPLIQLTEGGHSLTIRAPIDGEVLVVNEELSSNPSLLQEQLFSNGWGYVIKPSNLRDLKEMFIGQETKAWLRHEFQKLRDLFATRTKNGLLQPAFLQDGGPPIAGVLRTMDDDMWREIDQQFLQVHDSGRN